MAADLHEAFRRDLQANDERSLAAELLEEIRQRRAGHQRDVARANLPVRQIHAGGCLRRAADTQENHISADQAVDILAVIMREREVDRFHPLEIVFVHRMLAGDAVVRCHAEMPPEHRNRGVEHGKRRNAPLTAEGFEAPAKGCIRYRVPYHTGRRLDLASDALELAFGAHEVIVVFERLDILELRAGCALDGVQGLAGRIRDEVNVEIDGGPGRAGHAFL